MSYRTYVNGKQIFGNNYCYKKWIDFIKSKGIDVDNDGNYKGEIDDFMEALSVIEQIVMDTEEVMKKNRKSLFDLSFYECDLTAKYVDYSLFDALMEIIDNTILFTPYCFFKACEKDLEYDGLWNVEGHGLCYNLKPGRKIMVEAR